jgi:hypothetical protein
MSATPVGELCVLERSAASISRAVILTNALPLIHWISQNRLSETKLHSPLPSISGTTVTEVAAAARYRASLSQTARPATHH